jgi:hypothetical protein
MKLLTRTRYRHGNLKLISLNIKQMVKNAQGTYEHSTSYHKLNFLGLIFHDTLLYIHICTCVVVGRSYHGPFPPPPFFIFHGLILFPFLDFYGYRVCQLGQKGQRGRLGCSSVSGANVTKEAALLLIRGRVARWYIFKPKSQFWYILGMIIFL